MLSVKVFVFNPVAENTYVIFDEQKYAIIIDPGCYFDEEKMQLKMIFIGSFTEFPLFF